MKGLLELASKSIGPLLEQFKPQLEEFLVLYRQQTETQARIETKLDAVIAAQEERIKHLELQVEDHTERLGGVSQ